MRQDSEGVPSQYNGAEINTRCVNFADPIPPYEYEVMARIIDRTWRTCQHIIF